MPPEKPKIMEHEPSRNALPVESGGKTGTANNPQSPAASSAVPPLVASPGGSPALFGGHRGGGKKRADGLIAGSPAAIEADRKADAARKAAQRAAQKKAALPPPLPSVLPSSQNSASKGYFDSGTLLGTPADPAVPPSVAPMFTPWQQRILRKPADLLAKIVDRTRIYFRLKQVKRLKLSQAAEKEILDLLKYKQEILDDFALALSDAMAIELNNRRIGGANLSHWLTLIMSVGEIVAVEMNHMELIERLVMEDRAKNDGIVEPAKA